MTMTGWEIIAQSAHVHLAFKVQTRVHVSHVLRELTRQRQDLLAHRVWPANTEVSLAEFPRPRAVTARTTQILGMVAIMSLNAFATRDILVFCIFSFTFIFFSTGIKPSDSIRRVIVSRLGRGI